MLQYHYDTNIPNTPPRLSKAVSPNPWDWRSPQTYCKHRIDARHFGQVLICKRRHNDKRIHNGLFQPGSKPDRVRTNHLIDPRRVQIKPCILGSRLGGLRTLDTFNANVNAQMTPDDSSIVTSDEKSNWDDI